MSRRGHMETSSAEGHGGRAEVWSNQGPHSPCGNLQAGGKSQGWSFSQKSKESEPYIRTPSLGVLHCEDKPRKCLPLKTSGAYVQDSQRAIKNWGCALQGYLWNLTRFKSWHRGHSLKGTWIRPTCWSWRASWGAGGSWDSLQGLRRWSQLSCRLDLHAGPGTGRHHLGTLPLVC